MSYWVKGVLSGDSASRCRIKVPVLSLIAQKLPVTLQLGSMAIVIAFLIGIPAGIVSAVKKGTAWDLAPICSRCGASRRRISGSASC
jgi:peptide/nickel transport system permease protein